MSPEMQIVTVAALIAAHKTSVLESRIAAQDEIITRMADAMVRMAQDFRAVAEAGR